MCAFNKPELANQNRLGTLQIVFITFGIVSMLFMVGVVMCCFVQRHKRNSGARPISPEETCFAPTYPILNGQTLHDIIEMTTSGSGSGES
jgi:hypothetical protein